MPFMKKNLWTVVHGLLTGYCSINIFCYLVAFFVCLFSDRYKLTGENTIQFFMLPVIILLLLFIASKQINHETTDNNPAADNDKLE